MFTCGPLFMLCSFNWKHPWHIYFRYKLLNQKVNIPFNATLMCHWKRITTSFLNVQCIIEYQEITVENSASWKVKFCTKVQSSQISKFLGIFHDQKTDIISCHDCQFVKCKSQINKLAWFDFKYKKVHIHRIWDNEN